MKQTALHKLLSILETDNGHNKFDDKYDSSEDEPQFSRRTFCNEILLTSTGIILGARAVAGETATAQESVLAYPPVKIEGAEKLIVGSSLYFEYPTRNDPAVLLRSSEGEYTAFSRKCSHAGCSVEFDAAARCFKCPCHKGMFDSRIGYVMHGPPQRPLDQIVLQMRSGGQVWAVGKSIGKNAERIAQKSYNPEGFSNSGRPRSRL
jgi:Rieske Fe-S protein